MSSNADSPMMPAGTLLLSEKPFVYTLNSQYREQRCDLCFTENASLAKCSECRYVFYCDRNCQREAWSVHKYECRCLQNVAPRIVPDCARTLARLIMKLNKGGDHVKGYYTERLFRRWRDLMSHYEELKHDSKRKEHVATLSVVLRQLLGEHRMPNDVELLQLYGRLLVNSFNILDSDLNSVGTGIYLGVSITDHSCTPNAVVTFDGTTLNMRSIEPMKRIDFTKIYISYLDLMDTVEQRQKALQDTYFFQCKCTRCLDSKEDAEMNAAACPNANCSEPLDLRPASTPLAKCTCCGTPVTREHVKQFLEIQEITQNSIAEMQRIAYFDVCNVILQKHVGLLHPLNVHHIKLLDLAFESAINISKWSLAVEFGLRVLPGLRKYNGPLSPLVAVMHMKLGKLLLVLDRFAEAKAQLLEAVKVMQFTHGPVAIYLSQIRPLIMQAEMGAMRNRNGDA